MSGGEMDHRTKHSHNVFVNNQTTAAPILTKTTKVEHPVQPSSQSLAVDSYASNNRFENAIIEALNGLGPKYISDLLLCLRAIQSSRIIWASFDCPKGQKQKGRGRFQFSSEHLRS